MNKKIYKYCHVFYQFRKSYAKSLNNDHQWNDGSCVDVDQIYNDWSIGRFIHLLRWFI